jgi:RHS repeat-associated protein
MKHGNCISTLILACILLCGTGLVSAQWNPNYSIGTVTGKYAFNYNQVPDQLVEVIPPLYTAAPLYYQWEESETPLDNFVLIAGANQSSYTYPAALTTTLYVRRKVTDAWNNSVYSNTIKLELVSVNWENRSYLRIHDVLVPGVTSWQAIDQLPVGQRTQATTYMDGLGRTVQTVHAGVVTPAQGSSLWGDVVSFTAYDAAGRIVAQPLPYSTFTDAGKYKPDPATDVAAYYATNYNETSPYEVTTYEQSPLSRPAVIRSPGYSWAASVGQSAGYDVNTADDAVPFFTMDYSTMFAPGDVPELAGTYAPNTLWKTTGTDENGKKVIEYRDFAERLILSKTQLAANAGAGYTGWICVYSIYDDFGRLRYRLQPEAVQYLAANSWSFAGVTGTQLLNEWCFWYEYDEKGRTIRKKAPGAEALNILYDKRDRVVFLQDGNQAGKNPVEWTANHYDDLDRVTLTALYATNKTREQLQTDIDNAADGNIIPAWDLDNPAIATVVRYLYYDHYNFDGVQAFDAGFANTNAYGSSEPGVMPIAPDLRTLSRSTGSKVRVLNTTSFLNTTSYYDEKGRPVQSLGENIKAGHDIFTSQYHFDGRLLSSFTSHTTAATGYSNFGILSKNIYNEIGKLSSIEKRYGANAFKTIAAYEYDDLGRLKNKRLAPGYTGTGKTELESLTYSYNLYNNITGINKDYALKTPGNYNKWNNFFGLYLGYDNRDGVFNAAQLDGHVTGLLWNTQGDDAQRKYDYTYDNAGRLTNALFTEKPLPAGGWSNAAMDFSVTGAGGAITYDQHGNLLSMVHKGVIPGMQTPVVIDNLQYAYADYSNKLLKVTDNSTIGAFNGQFGDFKDGSNGAADDYEYDSNGNLLVDGNKNVRDLGNVPGANGIRYNFMDKPEEIHLAGKGTLRITYDGFGNKLQKVFTTEDAVPVETVTSYINGFVYEGDVLQYINFEEGRIRAIQPVAQNNGYDALQVAGSLALPDGKTGVFDYCIRDYQQNVRMMLTEEVHAGSNQCTMETARAGNEEPVFGQTGSANEVTQTRFAVADIPGQSVGGGWQNASIANAVSRLGNLAGHKTGPNALLKVMAGDVVNATTQYYYQNAVVNTAGGSTLAGEVLGSLLQAIAGSSVAGAAHGNTTGIGTSLGAAPPFINMAAPDVANAAGTNPKAYLTILFFDERFNFVEEGSAFARVQTAGVNNALLSLTDNKAPKNGYAYIYLSNESDEPVYFDNLQVAHNRGRIVEENHYYAFGLRIAAISSKKIPDVSEGAIANRYLYNNKALFEEGELNWYDYGFRNYDAQIGRFPQLDPLTDEYPYLTPFQYASLEPIANVDRDGLEKQLAINAAGEMVGTATLTAVVTSTAKKVAAQRIGAEIIRQAFKQTSRLILAAGTIGLTAVLTVIPLQGAIKGKPDGPAPPGYHWGGDQYIRNTLPDEIITSDPSSLTDDYLRGVQQRILDGTATFNDYKYKSEIFRRKIDGFFQGLKPAFRYAPSDKHRPGGWGTLMDLDDETAGRVLNESVEGGKQRYGVYNGKIYEFQPDNVGGYHGYPIPGTEAPIQVLRKFLQDKLINNALYNRLLKGK